MMELLDRMFLWIFIRIATLWFTDIAFTSCPKNGRVLTMMFSSNEGTIAKVFEYMRKENIL